MWRRVSSASACQWYNLHQRGFKWTGGETDGDSAATRASVLLTGSSKACVNPFAVLYNKAGQPLNSEDFFQHGKVYDYGWWSCRWINLALAKQRNHSVRGGRPSYRLETELFLFFKLKERNPNLFNLRGSKYLMTWPRSSDPSYPGRHWPFPFPLVTDLSHSSYILPSTHRALTPVPTSPPRNNTLPVESDERCVLLASRTCTLPLHVFYLTDATLQKPLGKPQRGGREGRLPFTFALLFITDWFLSSQ